MAQIAWFGPLRFVCGSRVDLSRFLGEELKRSGDVVGVLLSGGRHERQHPGDEHERLQR
jgi:hypothetical protein